MFSSQPGYVAAHSKVDHDDWWQQPGPMPLPTTQFNSQIERIQVFATVYLGKEYVIELQAAESQFDIVITSYFTT